MLIRVKLSVWFGLLVAAILILLAGIRYIGQKQILLDQKDFSLRVAAGILDASIPRKLPTEQTILAAMDRMVTNHPEIELKGMIIEVYDAMGRILYSSSLTEEERFPITEELWSEAISGRIRLLTLPLEGSSYPLRVLVKSTSKDGELLYVTKIASSMQNITTSLENTLFLSFFFIPSATLLLTVGGWFLTKRALQPLETVIQTAEKITGGDLSHRIQYPESGREIQRLVRAFNEMIVKLEGSFRGIQDFSDNVSHELRIPLSILRGETELILRRTRTNEEYRKVLESNLEEIQRMEKIVERLLFLSKADRGEIQLHRDRLDLGALIERIGRQFGELAREKEINLIFPVKRGIYVRADELMLGEVLLNLLQNAIQYTGGGGTVEVSVSENHDPIEISVSDTGMGIPEEKISHIFERFYQVDQSRASQGSGLGLSLVKSIVEAHDGFITVDSVEGKGSRFSVYLPNRVQPERHSPTG